MKVATAIAQILKREGAECIIGYPVNTVIEEAAKLDIRPIVVRQERTGLHMADAISRVTSGDRIGIFAMQHGPGTENSFGGVAQAYSESVPLIVIPESYPRSLFGVAPNFNAFLNFQHITKSVQTITLPNAISAAMRRAFTQARNGRLRPAVVEVPRDVMAAELEGPLEYEPTPRVRSGPDPRDVERAARVLVNAERPVIYAGQGVHYAKAWAELRALAELLEAPVLTSLEGKSAFPENHPLALGSVGKSTTEAAHLFLQAADVVFGVGCSFGITSFGISMPKGKTVVHATNDPADLNKDVVVQHALVGDAQLVLGAMIDAVRDRLGGKSRGRAEAVASDIARIRARWLAQWQPKIASDEVPLSPYRVLADLHRAVDLANTIITHDAGGPRDQLSPFWVATEPLSYIGWGKTTQLGYGLGLAMGAKLARPDKLCINVWGDAAIGMTGMDLETAARQRIPIMSILLNNFSMACELGVLPAATEKYRATDISGNYADLARALGLYAARVTTPDQIVPAIRRGIEKTREGTPVLLEFITQQEREISQFGRA